MELILFWFRPDPDFDGKMQVKSDVFQGNIMAYKEYDVENENDEAKEVAKNELDEMKALEKYVIYF